jgi:nitrate reductase NapE component
MLNPRHLLRMAKWARNPPSEKRVVFVFAVIAICLFIGGLDYLGVFPDWMRVNSLKP